MLNPEIRKKAETLARYVVKNGPSFEANVIEKHKGDPNFAFLTGGTGSEYYKECKERCGLGSTASASGARADTTAQRLASMGTEKASELLKQALRSLPQSYRQSLKSQLKEEKKENGQSASGRERNETTTTTTTAAAAAKSNPAPTAEALAGSGRAGWTGGSLTGLGARPGGGSSNDPKFSGSRLDPRLANPTQFQGATGGSVHHYQAYPVPPPRQNTGPPSSLPPRQPQAQQGARVAGSKADKAALTEVVKKYLKNPWKEGKLTRESFKKICKTVVEQFSSETFPLSEHKKKHLKRAVEDLVERYKK